MTYQSKKGNLLSNNILSEFVNHSHRAIQYLTDSIKQPFRTLTLREKENRLLEKRIDELLLERQKYQEAAEEIKRLRELLDLREKQTSYKASAHVIARGDGHLTNTFTLDKGRKDGVEKDMSVISTKGLAGKIFGVSDSYSRLLLITNINFSAAVRLKDSRREGVLAGTGAGKCILKYIPYEEEVNVGDIVITSGLDRLFPPGIPVGYVSRVDKKSQSGHFQTIEVLPFQDDTQIEEVLIIK